MPPRRVKGPRDAQAADAVKRRLLARTPSPPVRGRKPLGDANATLGATGAARRLKVTPPKAAKPDLDAPLPPPAARVVAPPPESAPPKAAPARPVRSALLVIAAAAFLFFPPLFAPPPPATPSTKAVVRVAPPPARVPRGYVSDESRATPRPRRG